MEIKLTQQENQLLRNGLHTLREKLVNDYEKENLKGQYANIESKIWFVETIIDIDKIVQKLEEILNDNK